MMLGWLIVTSLFASVPQIKVLIGRSLPQVQVMGTDLKNDLPVHGKKSQFNGKKMIEFNCSKNFAWMNNKNNKKTLLAAVSSPTGFVNWGKQKYQGELRIISSGQKNCDLVNLISLESYLSSLLNKEMRADWPIEVLKAQAVAARSYAIHKIKALNHTSAEDLIPYHLESSEKDQVSGSFYDTTSKTDKATRDTYGEVLTTKKDEVIEAFYHSKCGGKTFTPDQVWQNHKEGYSSVECPFCHGKGKATWREKLPKWQFAKYLDQILNKYYGEGGTTDPEQLVVVMDDRDLSQLKVYRGSKLHFIKKSMMRNVMGREVLPSNLFHMEDLGKNISIKGDGYGHGVGLCQLGALELAKRGYTYKEILKFYFPSFEIKKIY
jgi:stage II sporulation protein D